MKNKEAAYVINRQDARQSSAKPVVSRLPKTNRHRYPRCYEERTQTMAPSHPFTDAINPTSPAKTSKVLQKRLRPAALRSSSTPLPQATSTHSSAATEINKTVINDRPDRYCTTRPTAAAAAVGNQQAAAMPIQKVKVNISTNKNTDTTSVSVPGKIQTTNVDRPTTSMHQSTSKVLLQRHNLQINLADIKTSSTSTEPAVPDSLTTTTPTEKNKNKEITAFLVSHQTKVHPHRFRCKKRQKRQRWTQRE